MTPSPLIDIEPIHLFAYRLNLEAGKVEVRSVSKLASESIQKLPVIEIDNPASIGNEGHYVVGCEIIQGANGIEDAAYPAVFVHEDHVSDLLEIPTEFHDLILSENAATREGDTLRGVVTINGYLSLCIIWEANGNVRIDEIFFDLRRESTADVFTEVTHLATEHIWIDPAQQPLPDEFVDLSEKYWTYMNSKRPRPIELANLHRPVPMKFLAGSQENLTRAAKRLISTIMAAHGCTNTVAQVLFQSDDDIIFDPGGSSILTSLEPMILKALSLALKENIFVRDFDASDKLLCARTLWDRSPQIVAVDITSADNHHEAIALVQEQAPRLREWLLTSGFKPAEFDDLFGI